MEGTVGDDDEAGDARSQQREDGAEAPHGSDVAPPHERPRGIAFGALRHRDYRWLWAAQCVSLTGSQMQYAAIDWHIYLLTRSPLALGTVGAVRMAAILSLSLWGGVVADRLDRRKIMAVTQTSMLLGAIALAIGTRLGVENLLWLYVVTALTSAAGSSTASSARLFARYGGSCSWYQSSSAPPCLRTSSLSTKSIRLSASSRTS